MGRGQEGLPERSSTVWRTYERTATHARYVNISACVTWLRGNAGRGTVCARQRGKQWEKGGGGSRLTGADMKRVRVVRCPEPAPPETLERVAVCRRAVQRAVDSLKNKKAIEIHVPAAPGSNVVSRCTPAHGPWSLDTTPYLPVRRVPFTTKRHPALRPPALLCACRGARSSRLSHKRDRTT